MIITDGSGDRSIARHLANAAYLGISPKPEALTAVDSLTLRDNHEEGALNLRKIDTSGIVSPMMRRNPRLLVEGQGPLPKVSSIGISPAGDVYFHFEFSFVFREFDNNRKRCENPWEQDSPCSCQLFKAKQTLSEMASGQAPPREGNVECIDPISSIPWGADSSKVFQFDSASNVYFQGVLEGANQPALYRVARNKVNGRFVQDEIINSNICVGAYQIMPGGGLFYVGQNCLGGQWGGADGSYFRYVSPAGGLIEIARNWWDFQFEAYASPTGDKVVFYGPDPDASAVASWESACLFEFDPAKPQGERSTKLVSCNNNMWDWLGMRRAIDIATYGDHEQWRNPPAAWRTEYTRRCLSDNDTFIGGNGNPIRSLYRAADSKEYLVGNISQKNKGELQCQVELRGPHCLINNKPSLKNSAGIHTSTTCSTDGGTWVADGWCDDPEGNFYEDKASCDADAVGTGAGNIIGNATWHYHGGAWYDLIKYDPAVDQGNGNIQGEICLEEGLTFDENGANTEWDSWTDTSDTTMLKLNGIQCDEPAEKWTTEYKAIALVNRDTGQLGLLTPIEEQVSSMWTVRNTIYYSGFKQGLYIFNQVVPDTTNINLLSNFEVYHVTPSPRGATRVMFDGLNFGNNDYTFGDMDPTAVNVEASISISTGLSGRVKTMLIYGN